MSQVSALCRIICEIYANGCALSQFNTGSDMTLDAARAQNSKKQLYSYTDRNRLGIQCECRMCRSDEVLEGEWRGTGGRVTRYWWESDEVLVGEWGGTSGRVTRYWWESDEVLVGEWRGTGGRVKRYRRESDEVLAGEWWGTGGRVTRYWPLLGERLMMSSCRELWQQLCRF